MDKQKFILLNLENPESKDLAQAIGSETARKILDLLSEKSLTETTISKRLNIPLSTAHYNIQQLLKANLIEIKGFVWSDKGKKINIYKVANKLIIIAPKNTSASFLEKIKDIIPVSLAGLVASAGIYIYQKLMIPVQTFYPITETIQEQAPYIAQDTMQKAVSTGSYAASSGASATAGSSAAMIANNSLPNAASYAQPIAEETTNYMVQDQMRTLPLQEPNYALWFLLGVAVIVTVYVIYKYIKHKINN